MTVTKKAIIGTTLCLAGVLGVWLIDYLALYRPEPVSIPGSTRLAEQLSSSKSAQDDQDKMAATSAEDYRQSFISAENIDLEIETVVEGLEVPWSIVFTGSERMLITERPGRVREVVAGVLTESPLLVVDEVQSNGEIGMMGMVAHPDYEQNQLLYICYGYQSPTGIFNKVIAARDQGSSVEVVDEIIDKLPSARNHAGCELAISPDEKLFITVGDALERDLAQNMDTLAGKIIRLNLDGSIPDDNPFPASEIYSFGHRNPQGLAWHPLTNELYSTEHGPSVFDGPAGGDEVNLIQPGSNYGWPVISHEQTGEGMETGLLVYTPAVAPATAAFYDADLIPELRGSFLFGGLRGTGLYRVVFDLDDPTQVVAHEQMPQVDVGRVRVVEVGPDGAIYIGTSNRDGRGSVRRGDDAILRIVAR
ncbi:MAG: PQQ-dependent sugar dehydrogenase [Patescibacteria group bacterium]